MFANILTISRLPLAAGFATAAWLLVHDGTVQPWGAAVLFALAAGHELTDAMDGYIAQRLGGVSALGGILDPLADSLGRLTIYFAMSMTGMISIVVPLVMAGRDIVAAYTRIAAAMTGRPTAARLSGKLKAIVQAGGIFLIVAIACKAGAFQPETLTLTRNIVGGVIVTVTVWSLADYIFAGRQTIGELLGKK